MNRDDTGTDARRRFGSLCESLRPDLLRFAYWLGRDRQLAEDVVQEAMLRAWKSLDSLTEQGKAKSWLLTIVRREFARSFERKRLEVFDLDALVAAEADVLAAEDDGELEQMREALFRPGERIPGTWCCRTFMGYPTKEIADAMGMQQRAC